MEVEMRLGEREGMDWPDPRPGAGKAHGTGRGKYTASVPARAKDGIAQNRDFPARARWGFHQADAELVSLPPFTAAFSCLYTSSGSSAFVMTPGVITHSRTS